MPLSAEHPEPPDTPTPFLGFTAAEVDGAVQSWGWPKFRGKQLRDWVYVKGVTDPARMTNLSARDQATVAERFSFATGVDRPPAVERRWGPSNCCSAGRMVRKRKR